MAPPREIPGFYYDEKKKKYFKIQPNHTVGAGSRYTSDDVKKRKQRHEAAQEQAVQKKLEQQRVLRAPTLGESSLSGGILAREYGTAAVSNSRKAAQTLVGGWTATEILSSKLSRIPRNSIREHNYESPPMAGFAYDTPTRALFYDDRLTIPSEDQGALGLSVVRNESVLVDSPKSVYSRFHRTNRLAIYQPQSLVTTIELEPNSRTLLCTGQSEILVAELADPGGFRDRDYDFVTRMVLFDLNEDIEIFATCSAKPSSEFLFAIGSSEGIHAIDKLMNHAMLCKITDSHVLAVAPFQDQCFMAGERNGTIQVYDPRIRRLEGNKIFHSSAVRHIRQLNTHTIVVAGLHSTLCNYDTRFTKSVELTRSWSRPHGDHSRPDRQCTMPSIKYPKYKNEAYLDMGFDVDQDNGLVAAVVQKDRLGVLINYDKVNMFSSQTGELLRSLDPEVDGRTIDNQRAKSLRFVADGGDGMPKSLWVAKGSKMISYEW